MAQILELTRFLRRTGFHFAGKRSCAQHYRLLDRELASRIFSSMIA